MALLERARLAGLKELSDAEVVRRVLGGEGELFELLLRRYNQRLFRVARGILADDGEAEDVLQDAWVRAYRHLAGFRGESSLPTWLARITTHEAWARARKARRFVALPDEADASGPADLAPNPEAGAAEAELRATLERAVAALPPPYRSAFLLREVEGLSTAEAAQALEISAGALKVRLHRARALLRRDIQRRFGTAVHALFGFAAERCDRTVAAVLARIGAD